MISTFTLRKVEDIEVSIDFDKIYEAVKNDLDVSPEDYDSIDEYNEELSEFFSTNCTVFLNEVAGLNFSEDEDGPYYDIEANDGTLDDICDAFEDYLKTRNNK